MAAGIARSRRLSASARSAPIDDPTIVSLANAAVLPSKYRTAAPDNDGRFAAQERPVTPAFGHTDLLHFRPLRARSGVDDDGHCVGLNWRGEATACSVDGRRQLRTARCVWRQIVARA
jgi:hypothetical protein